MYDHIGIEYQFPSTKQFISSSLLLIRKHSSIIGRLSTFSSRLTITLSSRHCRRFQYHFTVISMLHSCDITGTKMCHFRFRQSMTESFSIAFKNRFNRIPMSTAIFAESRMLVPTVSTQQSIADIRHWNNITRFGSFWSQ